MSRVLPGVPDTLASPCRPAVSYTHLDVYKRQRVISVQSTLGAGVALGDVVAEVEKLISEYHTPDGVDLEVGGTVEDQGDAFGDLGVLAITI